MKEEYFLKEVIKHTMQIATSDNSVMIIDGERLSAIDEYDAEYIAKVMKKVSDKVVPFIINTIKPSTDFSKADNLLSRAFMFYFDK
ncbi:MAG: hypothetical protein GZ091_07645 [Paludibacter sp.]|nr:hypothetical protein [Paludibacter sp.]